MPRSCWGKSHSGMSADDIELWLPGKTTSSSRRPQSSRAPLQASEARGAGAGRGRPIHAMAATRTAARPSTTPSLSRALGAAARGAARSDEGKARSAISKISRIPTKARSPPTSATRSEVALAGRSKAKVPAPTSRVPRRSRPLAPPGGVLEPGHEAPRRSRGERSARPASERRRGARGRCRRGRAPRCARSWCRHPTGPRPRLFASGFVGQRRHDRPARRPQEEEHEPRHQQVQTEAREGVPWIARQQEAGEGEERRPQRPGGRPAIAAVATDRRAAGPRDRPGFDPGRPERPALAAGSSRPGWGSLSRARSSGARPRRAPRRSRFGRPRRRGRREPCVPRSAPGPGSSERRRRRWRWRAIRGRNAVRSGSCWRTALVMRSATKAATRGSVQAGGQPIREGVRE